MELNNLYSCDFETTTLEDDCRVWAYGCQSLKNDDEFYYGNCIEDFMSWELTTSIFCRGELTIFFHNLKFDGSFIINWLYRNGYKYQEKNLNAKGLNKHTQKLEAYTFNSLISNFGQYYMIEIYHYYDTNSKKWIKTKILDSYKKLPFKVEVIADAFHTGLKKLDLDYTSFREKGHKITDKELPYLQNDCKIVSRALSSQISEGLIAMTNGSDALSHYKKYFTKKEWERFFPKLSIENEDDMRSAYYGGCVQVNPLYQEKDIGQCISFDVKSLYPSIMYFDALPYGKPIGFDGKYKCNNKYPLFIQSLRCEYKLKPNHMPTIRLKNSYLNQTCEFSSESIEPTILKLTNIDIELFFKHYDVYNIEYINGYMFKSSCDLFKKYIDKWFHVKNTSSGAMKQFAKLMLNSLYGKFATNYNVTGKKPVLVDDKLTHVEDVKTWRDPVYTPIGIFITSYGRYKMISTAQSNYKYWIYGDTDSNYFNTWDIDKLDIDIGDELGQWEFEGFYTKARFLRPKTYIKFTRYNMDECKNYDEHVEKRLELDYEIKHLKCAGLPQSIDGQDNHALVTWDNFHVGLKIDGSKLRPKQVKNGVVLVKSDFNIRLN